MIQLFLRGGPLFMVPLLLASVGVVAVAIERVLRYRRAEVDYDTFLSGMRDALQEGGVGAGRRYADSIPGPVARVWSEGLTHSQLPLPLLRERMEGAAVSEVSRLERHLSHLDVVAQVAPLLGILGTVWGMIVAFEGVAGGLAAGVGVDGERLTAGIAQALVTTGAGLAVAIPATIVSHALRSRVERFVEALEQSMRDVLTTVTPTTARRSRSHSVDRDSTASPVRPTPTAAR